MVQPAAAGQEYVVLLDEQGQPTGRQLKATVHHRNTPYHLAFSCYLLNDAGEVLITRRALGKIAWPGIWTNSFCGHPLPQEEMSHAVARRAAFELGAEIGAPQLLHPTFRYLETDSSGIVENELCPVYMACLRSSLAPNSDEVQEAQWLAPEKLLRCVTDAPFLFSPWMVAQLACESVQAALLRQY